jgi:hypothetical protein
VPLVEDKVLKADVLLEHLVRHSCESLYSLKEREMFMDAAQPIATRERKK